MEKQRPFFSVVMPIYNVEKHLKQAIDSVLNQSFQNFELILVDDCSPDKCADICDEYSSQNEKISVIHHEVNKGLSAARNTGMMVAQGKYIWFMDSDDYVDDELFLNVYESVKVNPAQVIVFGLVEEYFDENARLHHTQIIKPKKYYLETKEDVHKEIINLEMKTLYGYAWNKFYDLEYMKNIGIKYENVTLIEDILFNVKYCMEIERMNILDITPYHYNKRMDNSLTSKFVPDYYRLHRRRIAMIYKQYKHWGMCTEYVIENLGVLYTRYIFSALQRNCDKRAQMNFRKRKKWIHSVFQDELFNEIIPNTKADSGVLKLMSFLLKRKCELGCVALGRILYVVKKYLPMLFSKMKQKR